MTVKLIPYNPFDHLLRDDDIPLYLSEAAADDDPRTLVTALGHVLRHKGVANIAAATGLNRESLYKLTRKNPPQPKWDTVHRLLRALGLKWQAAA